jgi:hypothetical protein
MSVDVYRPHDGDPARAWTCTMPGNLDVCELCNCWRRCAPTWQAVTSGGVVFLVCERHTPLDIALSWLGGSAHV